MGSRHAGSVYDEREYYSREEVRAPAVRVRDREYEEVDTYIRRDSQPGRRPDFLRDDYNVQSTAGPMVVRERELEYSRPLERRPRDPSPEVQYHERITTRDRSPDVQERVRTSMRVERSVSPPPDRLRARVIETRERIPVRQRSPSPAVQYRERYVERRERSPSPIHDERIHITQTRETRRSPSPSIRSLSPAPPPPPIQAPPIHQEIITHHRHIDHGFEHARVPTPPPPPRRSTPRVKETDIDIYQSRGGTEVDIHQKTTGGSLPRNAQSLTRRNDYYDDDFVYEQEREKLKVRDNRLMVSRRRSVSARPTHRDKVRIDLRDNESESDFYARKAGERAYIGEAYHGATKDWAIVDVPPGTQRVRMEGVGGGAEEITWQKYNGVRRSKFIPERERDVARPREIQEPRRELNGLDIEISSHKRSRGNVYSHEYERIQESSSDRRVGMPRASKSRVGDLWTEITKDLVVKEAIEHMGYDYEETEYFYYVIQYLGYEEVLALVQLSEKIRRERAHRLRELDRERHRMEKHERERVEWGRHERRRSRHTSQYDDEKIVEREIVFGGPRRHY